MNYEIKFSKQANKDYELIRRSHYKDTLEEMLTILETNPYQPKYEKLNDEFDRMYSRRINIKHRLAYKIYEDKKVVYILRMWSHYDKL